MDGNSLLKKMIKENAEQNLLENSKEKEKSKALKEMFGDNFDNAKTIELKEDVNEHNEPVSLGGDKKAFWTSIKNPESNESIECKVYTSGDSESMSEVIIICPGYKGDLALQEKKYADYFVNYKRGLIVLRHNGLRIHGEDMKNFLHCPEKEANSKLRDQKYLGPSEYKFSFLKANKEVLTALKSLSNKINKINIIGHSWGARIALESILELNTSEDKKSVDLKNRVSNLVLMGAWLETRKDVLKHVIDYFDKEKDGDYFVGMETREISDEILLMADRIKNIQASSFPPNVNLFGLHSIGDSNIDFENETSPFFSEIAKQKDKINKFGFVVLKSLEEYSKPMGNRFTDSHDYDIDLPGLRGWLEKMLSQ